MKYDLQETRFSMYYVVVSSYDMMYTCIILQRGGGDKRIYLMRSIVLYFVLHYTTISSHLRLVVVGFTLNLIFEFVYMQIDSVAKAWAPHTFWLFLWNILNGLQWEERCI